MRWSLRHRAFPILTVLSAPPEQTVSIATIAHEEDGGEEHEATDGTRPPLQEEPSQVQDHKHGMVIQEGRVQRLGYQQNGDEPL